MTALIQEMEQIKFMVDQGMIILTAEVEKILSGEKREMIA